MKRYFYVIHDDSSVSDYGLVEVSKDRYINGCPIEDYGNYILSESIIENPLADYMDYLKENNI